MENKTLKRKTGTVIVITVITMVTEIIFGIITKSMALTADGFHMGTHAAALFITYAVCVIISKNKYSEPRLNNLGGYTSALLLGITAGGIIYEACERLIHPKTIIFNEAIIITVIGLLINMICIMIMGQEHHNHDHNNHRHDHENEIVKIKNGNLNYKAAYIHIATDAFTSVLAIIALLAGKYLNMPIFDPLTGILGGIIILKWAISLIKDSFTVLVTD